MQYFIYIKTKRFENGYQFIDPQAMDLTDTWTPFTVD